MERYIGLDAHTQSCTFAVMGSSGRRLREQVVETSARPLIDFVTSIAGRRMLCMEEGTLSEWLYELLQPHVEELVVVQPSEHKGNKSDAIDSWTLADQLQRGRVETRVFKAPDSFTALREAVRAHRALTRDMVRAKTRLHAVYRSRGIQGMGDEIYDAEQRDRWLHRLPPHRRALAKLLSSELEGLMTSQAQAEHWLAEEAHRISVVSQLRTAPGIGLIRSAQIVAVVVTPHRFRTKRQFWSYCGLGIVTRSSSDWVRDSQGWARKQVAQTRGLNRNRNPLLKEVFKGAAMTVLGMHEHPLRVDYDRMLAAGTKPNLARLTLARRIAAAVLAMWKKKEDYDPAKHRATQAA